jgi:hypothetical protein
LRSSRKNECCKNSEDRERKKQRDREKKRQKIDKKKKAKYIITTAVVFFSVYGNRNSKERERERAMQKEFAWLYQEKFVFNNNHQFN